MIPKRIDRERGQRPPFCARRLKWPLATVLCLALFEIWLAISPAKADWIVCNRSRVLVNLAVGYSIVDDFATEGWWTVTPGSCSTPIHGPLRGRYVYVYAKDISDADILKGSVSMCVDRGKFKIRGISDCWRRGLQAVNFVEIDTREATDWTTFLTDPAK